MSHPVVRLDHVSKAFQNHVVLDQLDLEIFPEEFVIIQGPSGCGKSTLLSLIGLLDQADQGSVELFGQKRIPVYSHQSRKLLHDRIGWLFQNYALVDDLSVFANLQMVLPARMARSRKKERIEEALSKVGLPGLSSRKISSLSGGEQQRIAMARLLLKPCDLILADEPTGNLDPENARKVMDLFELLHKQGKTIIAVSHDPTLTCYATRIVKL